MLCLLIVHLKNHLFLSWFSLTFQLKPNDGVSTNSEYNGYMLMKDMSLKQRIPCIIYISIFAFWGKKCALHMDKYSTTMPKLTT